MGADQVSQAGAGLPLWLSALCAANTNVFAPSLWNCRDRSPPDKAACAGVLVRSASWHRATRAPCAPDAAFGCAGIFLCEGVSEVFSVTRAQVRLGQCCAPAGLYVYYMYCSAAADISVSCCEAIRERPVASQSLIAALAQRSVPLCAFPQN